MKQTDVIALAEESAVFFRRLVEEGMPMDRVGSLVAAFVTARVIAEGKTETLPVDPWRDDHV